MDLKYDVSIIIINYNGKRYIDNLFQSFLQMDTNDLTYEIVMVNNGNEDNSIEYLIENYGDMQQLKIVDAGDNLGYAGGNNVGVEHAEGEYIVFLNNDTAVDKYWLVNMYNFIKDTPTCGMVNSKLLFFYDFISVQFWTIDKILLSSEIKINGISYKIENKFCKNILYQNDRIVCFGNSEISIPLLKGCCDTKIEFFCLEDQGKESVLICCDERIMLENNQQVMIGLECGKLEKYKYSLVQNAGSGINENYDGYDIGFGEKDSEKYHQSYEVMIGCGAAIMMLKKDFIECGMFDNKFFMYYEDVDLSFRLRKLGKNILFCPQAIVRHVHTGSSEEWSPFFCYQVGRNKLLFLLKNYSFFTFLVYFMRQIKNALRTRNKYQMKGSIDAVKVGILGRNIRFKL